MPPCRCVKPKRMLVWDDKYSFSVCPKCGQWWRNKAKWVQWNQKSYRVSSAHSLRLIRAAGIHTRMIQNIWRKLQ